MKNPVIWIGIVGIAVLTYLLSVRAGYHWDGHVQCIECGTAAKVSVPRTETTTVYMDNASPVMMGMMMSGQYKSVHGTNDNGKWTITAVLN